MLGLLRPPFDAVRPMLIPSRYCDPDCALARLVFNGRDSSWRDVKEALLECFESFDIAVCHNCASAFS